MNNLNSPEITEFEPEVEADLKRWEKSVDEEIRAFLAARPLNPSEDEQQQYLVQN